MSFRSILNHTFCLLLISPTIHADNIDLQCEQMAEKIITRLKQENLLYSSASDEYRVRAISLEACEGNQQSIQQQHDEGIQNALKNWFTESTGGKAGNKRLRNLKR